MKLLRTIRLDPSDTFVFERAAEPGEWAVSGAFMFSDADPNQLDGKPRAAFFPLQRRRIGIRKNEGAAHRPFARLGGALEHKCIRRIETDGAKKLHARGPFASGSYQDGSSSTGNSLRRSTSVLPIRRTSKSPFSSMSRRTPFSAGSRDKYSRATAPKP